MTPNTRGALFGLAAAATFGVSAPIAKLLLAEVEPFLLAGLLYAGGGLVLSVVSVLRRRTVEAPLKREDGTALAIIVVLGGAVAPILLLLGLDATSAVSGSLLLNLEAPFTILVAATVFREHVGGRLLAAAALIVAGGAFLGLPEGKAGGSLAGALFIAAACACWAIDNNLTQRLSLRDPVALVRVKTLGAGSVNVALALALGYRVPEPDVLVAALALGGVAYGASILLDAKALREIGAAREAAFFASAPFIGALVAFLVFRDAPGGLHLVAMSAMAIGVAVLVRERHSHLHSHEELEHEHLHVHDEHHRHEHRPDDPPGEPHSHRHRHEPLTHDHPHAPDLHHRHPH